VRVAGAHRSRKGLHQSNVSRASKPVGPAVRLAISRGWKRAFVKAQLKASNPCHSTDSDHRFR
jgi:hypothetical protein